MTNRQVSLKTKLFYGVGEISITVSMVIFGLFILFFYNSVMKLPATWVGFASAVGLLWDAGADPYIGHLSDSFRGRLGRRHPFMLAGSLSMGICLWLLLSPPQGLGKAQLFLWLLGTILLFRTASAVFRIPYLSFGAELSSDYHERTSVVGYRSLFGLLGTVGAASLSFFLFFPAADSGLDPKFEHLNYSRMGLFFGIVMTAVGLITVWGTRHRRHGAFPQSLPGRRATFGARDFARAWKTVFLNRPFRQVCFSFSLFFLAVVLTSVLSIHYLTWYVRLPGSETIGTVQAFFWGGAVAGIPIWMRLSRFLEKRFLYLAATLGLSCLLMAAAFLMGEGHLFGTGNPLPLFAGNLLGGLLAGAVWLIPGSMMADVADQDEACSGLRREGILFGLLNFGEKIAAGLSLLLGGLLLDHFVQLAPGQVHQAPLAASRLGWVYGFLPGSLLLAAALLMRGYALDRRQVQDIQAELGRRKRPAAVGPQQPQGAADGQSQG